MSRRTYRYMKEEALYPFGYGLSYTEFKHSQLKLDKNELPVGDELHCSIKVENTGKFAAFETIRLYISDLEADIDVPRWQLAGLRNVFMKPGQDKTIEFTLTSRHMSIIDASGKRVVEPGRFGCLSWSFNKNGLGNYTVTKLLTCHYAYAIIYHVRFTEGRFT